MSELDKLEKYLLDHRITYERIDRDAVFDRDKRIVIQYGRHQICVPQSGEECRWDVICHPHSYGYEQGKLELYGELVTEDDGDSVVGWLTAEDVIKRLEAKQ